MKKVYLKYAKYNFWANAQIIKMISKLDETQIQQELGGSFPTVFKTVHHLYGAEKIWLQRLLLDEKIVWPSEEISFELLLENWQKTSQGLIDFIETIFNDEGIEHKMEYKNLKKEIIKTSVGDALHQVFNHASFHRGQLINYLRLLGETKILATDYIFWVK